MENEEVYKLILNSMCSNIKEKVMDLGNVYPMDCKSIPRHKSSSPKNKKKSKSSSKISVQKEGSLLEQ
jgi:hypothetical protein